MKKDDNWNKKQFSKGCLLILTGMVLIFVSQFFGETNIQDFISGLLLGAACGVMLVGAYTIARIFRRKK